MIVDNRDPVAGATEPPTGILLDQFLADVKVGVMERIQPRERARLPLGLAGTITSAVLMLAVGTATGAAVAGGVLNAGLPVSGTAMLALPVPDFEATQLVVTMTCLSEGQYTVSVPGMGSEHMTVGCDSGTGRSSGTTEFEVADATVARALSITTSAGGTYTVDAEYVARGAYDYPTNDRGQSYGSPVDEATNAPDLIFAVGEDDDGLPVQGYVLYADTRFPEGLPDDGWIPWLAEFHSEYPSGQPLPLYSSNGTSVIGTFHLHR